jgi:hypothetical protein
MPEPPADLWSGLDPDVPIALLPVRVETSFGSRPGVTSDGTAVDVPVLRVRFFPDDVSVVSQPAGLTAAEIAAGNKFWSAHREPRRDREDDGALAHRRHAAWEVLARRVGPTRARAVADATRDGDPPSRGEDPSATARLLPDGWVVVGHRAGERAFSAYVRTKVDEVQVGPSRPRGNEGTDAFDPHDPHLVAPRDRLRWVTDFEEAEKIGMAATIPLATPEQVAGGEIPPVAEEGVDTLTVVGIRAPGGGRTPASEAERLAGLLTDQSASERLAFVRPGTPTNNIAGRRTGWTDRPGVFDSYDRATNGTTRPAPATGAEALRGGADNATTLSAALGFPPSVLAAVEGAGDLDQWGARCMARALFPVTIGEVLGLCRPVGSDPEAHSERLRLLDDVVPFAAEHMASFVRGRGPLPVLRVGRQPYGVLPILPLARWGHRPSEPPVLNRLVGLLRSLRPFWEEAARRVPTLTGDTGGGQATARLVSILGRGAVPHPGAYALRDVAGPLVTAAYEASDPRLSIEDATVDSVLERDGVRDAVADDVRRSGYREALALAAAAPVEGTHLEALRLLGATGIKVEVARSQPDAADPFKTPASYLRALVAGRTGWAWPFFSFPAELDSEAEPHDLLYQLVKQSLALAADLPAVLLLRHVAADSAAEMAGVSTELLSGGLQVGAMMSDRFEGPLSGLRSDGDPVLPARLASKTLKQIIEDDGLRDDLRGELHLSRAAVDMFPGTEAAVTALADADYDDETYTRLVGETLACCANRLDAWITSVAAKRLEAIRSDRPSGLQIGCWGLLVDVRRDPKAPIAQPPPGWEPGDDGPGALGAAVARGPLVAPDRQIGYVHAPSLGQATTAGILRAGEVSHAGDGSTVAAVDLTSGRVRTALALLEAVRNGQPLGAVLGYRFERALGDAGLHKAVTALRADFPQRRRENDGAGGTPVAGDDAVVPAEVLDGLDVWQAGLEAAAARAHVGPRARQAFDRCFAELDRVVEAVADLLVAEGVHQLAAGHTHRAGATFAAMAEGGEPPLDFDVVRAPRSGAVLTHRLALLVDAGGTSGWDRTRPRAVLAPDVERWVEGILGPAGRWRFVVTGSTPEKTSARATVTLRDLGCCALDVVMEAVAGVDAVPALARRLAARAHVEVTADAAVDGIPLGSDGTVPSESGLGDGPVPWARLVAVAGAIGEVLGAARPVVPADLSDPPDTPATVQAITVEPPRGPTLQALLPILRAVAKVASDLEAACRVAERVTARARARNRGGSEVEAELLEPFAALGIPGSVITAGDLVPRSVLEGACAAARQTLVDVDQLLDAADGEATGGPAPSRRERLKAVACHPSAATAVGTLVAAARRIGGPATVPVIELRGGLRGRVLTGGDAPSPALLEEWLGRASRVRAAVAAYDDLRLFAEAGGHAPDPLAVAQLPRKQAEGWLGGPLRPLDAGDSRPENPMRRWVRPNGPRTHVVVAGGSVASTGGRTRGLILDEWVEVLPAPTITTGLALHYDAPDARPPQSVLLAVHPDPATPWGWELLDEVVCEALSLARLRLVELDELPATAIDEFVPLTYVRDGIGNGPRLGEKLATGPWLGPLLAAHRFILGG